MGVTVDLIPRLPGESPEDAIERVYDGGIRITLGEETPEGRWEEMVSSVDPAPDGAFDEWRAEVLRRLYAVFPGWKSEDVDGYPHLWTPGYLWQIEFSLDSVTLRWRSFGDDSDVPEEGSVIRAFEGLRTILHWPDEYGSYCDLDDPNHPETGID